MTGLPDMVDDAVLFPGVAQHEATLQYGQDQAAESNTPIGPNSRDAADTLAQFAFRLQAPPAPHHTPSCSRNIPRQNPLPLPAPLPARVRAPCRQNAAPRSSPTRPSLPPAPTLPHLTARTTLQGETRAPEGHDNDAHPRALSKRVRTPSVSPTLPAGGASAEPQEQQGFSPAGPSHSQGFRKIVPYAKKSR
jgi:hypothetical protein